MSDQNISNPKISVILPVYNAEDYLEDAIDSILNQDHVDFELIIVNDGSTDNSKQIIESYLDPRIIVINQINSGIAKSLNTAINSAKGQYIARMDADDISLPNRLRLQAAHLDKHKKTVLVASDVIYIDQRGNYLGFSVSINNERATKERLRKGNIIFHPTVMFRKRTFTKTNGYNEHINKYIEDFILWHELLKRGDISIINKPLLKYRTLNQSVSRNSPEGLNKIIQKIGESGGGYPELSDDFRKLTSAQIPPSPKRKYGISLPIAFYPTLSAARNILYTIKNANRCLFPSGQKIKAETQDSSNNKNKKPSSPSESK